MRRLAALSILIALVAIAAVAAATSSGEAASKRALAPAKGGTLKIVNGDDVDYLDTADAYSPVAWALQRLYSRTLYAYKSSRNARVAQTAYPDLAAGPPKITGKGTIYTFTLRSGVRWAPPVNRELQAKDFVYALHRLFDKKTPSSGQPYALLIKGAEAFAKGKAKSISGIRALGPRTLQIQLEQAAGDFLSILTMGFFAPVPQEAAAKVAVGSAYSKKIVGLGPYMLGSYAPGKSMTFVRNPNWNARTDPLRKAWVDRVEVKMGMTAEAATLAIIRGDADLSLNLDPPVANLGSLMSDSKTKNRFTTKFNGCVEYMPLNMNPKAGPISNVKVRRAINYAIDKQSLRRTRGGTFAGDIASTILPPTQFGYKPYNLYPSKDSRGNVEKAKQLLREAGYPNGLTLNYVGMSTGFGPAFTTSLQAALAKVGIKLNIKTYQGFSIYFESLLFPAKRMEHQIADAEWCPDYPGDGARSFFLPLFHSKSIMAAANNNMAEYAVPAVDKLIDKALAEPNAAKRAKQWEALDKRIMLDAPWAPWLYARQAFVWSERLGGWAYSPWHHNADVSNLSVVTR